MSTFARSARTRTLKNREDAQVNRRLTVEKLLASVESITVQSMASGDMNIAVRYKTEAPDAPGRMVIADELTRMLRNRVYKAKAR